MALKRRLRAVRGHRYRYFRRELVPPPDAGETSGPFCGAPAPEEAVLWPFAGSIGAGATVLWLGQPASSGIAAGGFPGLLVTDAALPVSRPWRTAVRQDWSALPFRAAAFDLACADLDPASWDEARTRLCVRELRRVVKPGGSVFLRVGPWTGGKAQPWGRLSELVSSFLAARRIVSKLRVQLPVWGFAVEASYAAFPSAREPRYVIDARDWRSMSYLFFRLPVALERHVLGQALLRLVFAAATRLFDRRTETPAPAFALHGVAR
jgi:SAM-dependent methyltransferase